MLILARIIGILMIAAGILDLIRPDILKRVIKFFEEGKRLYAVGVIRIAISVLLFLIATQCRIAWFVFAFGVLALVAGIMNLLMPLEKQKEVIKWFENQTALVIRFFAVLAVILGALLVYSV